MTLQQLQKYMASNYANAELGNRTLKLSLCLIKYHDTKMYEVEKALVHAFLNSTLIRSERPAPRSRQFTPGERNQYPCFQRILAETVLKNKQDKCNKNQMPPKHHHVQLKFFSYSHWYFVKIVHLLNKHTTERACFQSKQFVRSYEAMGTFAQKWLKTITYFVLPPFPTSFLPYLFLPPPSLSYVFDLHFPFFSSIRPRSPYENLLSPSTYFPSPPLPSSLLILYPLSFFFFFLFLTSFSSTSFSCFPFLSSVCSSFPSPPVVCLSQFWKNLTTCVTFSRTRSASKLQPSPRLASWICSELPTWGRTHWSCMWSGSACTLSTTGWSWILATSGEIFT